MEDAIGCSDVASQLLLTHRVKIQFIGFDHLEGEGVHLSPGDELRLDAIISLRAPSERAAATREVATINPPTEMLWVGIGQPALLLFGIILARWLLRRIYRAAIMRQMRRRSQPAKALTASSSTGAEVQIKFRETPNSSGEGAVRANLARQAARRQMLGRWAAVVVAALAQSATLAFWGGVTFIEHPNGPLLESVLSQAQLFLSSCFFLLAIIVPGLIRSGQTSAVSWWLFAAPIGMLVAVVPAVMMERQVESPTDLAVFLIFCLALGYGILVGSLSAAFLAKRLLRLSPEAFAFLLAGSVGAAINAFVLKLETGTSLGWWALFIPAEVIIFTAPYILGMWTGPRSEPIKLLFLRTFGNASRSDGLLRAVCGAWLTAGEMDVIMGPDIAASTASPEGVLRFATLLLGHYFIRSATDLEKRLRSRTRPALDGRYEVREFPCFDDTWRVTMQRLADVADAILVDLRGYTTANFGTAFELTALDELRALERTLLVVDDSTPIQSVRAALAAGGVSGQVATFRVSDRSSRGDVVRILLSRIAAQKTAG